MLLRVAFSGPFDRFVVHAFSLSLGIGLAGAHADHAAPLVTVPRGYMCLLTGTGPLSAKRGHATSAKGATELRP